MHIKLIAVGKRMPSWVTSAVSEYTSRLPKEFKLELVEIPAIKRSKNSDLEKIMQKEGELQLAAIPASFVVIALDMQGHAWDSGLLAKKLQQWQHNAQDIALLIGGADGLANQCKQHATQIWSLSSLTLPHPLVRIVLVEQLYRATCILRNHPYHK